MKDAKPIIAVSAIRFFQGGTIVIVNECLKYLAETYSHQYQIKALVYQKELYQRIEGIDWVEFPKARKNIFYRLYYEYYYFKKLSKSWQPRLWLSLQDSTPAVTANQRAVYFHNPLLLHKLDLKTWYCQPRLAILSLLYKYVYTQNINKNDAVFVQQQHIARFLINKYRLSEQKVWVFSPKDSLKEALVAFQKERLSETKENSPYTFIYPATAFYYKNHDIIVKACNILKKQAASFKILLTVDGLENKHIARLVKKARLNCPQIEFLGFIKRETLFNYYAEADCMLYPSKMESWGLPLTEFALQRKPIICADLAYAHESLAGYDKACFFNPDDAMQLAALMHQAINGRLKYEISAENKQLQTIDTWSHCFDLLLKKN